jgi:DNA-binding NtrC family response regulator
VDLLLGIGVLLISDKEAPMGVTGKPLQGAKLLFVEDEAILALDMINMLLDAGAEVVGPVLSVKRAVELAESQTIDCGFFDVTLKDGLVFPAAEVLRQKGAGIVFYTGQADLEAIRQDWPEAKVLQKPAPLAALMQAVIEACVQIRSRSSEATPGLNASF